ncbi:MAG: hypothetical protein PHE56_11295, partial [Bacteroidales bacterium]|nr:hypothetical protein [Bacteroidales bacterium]
AYDKIGNLIQDPSTGVDIQNIAWTASGKVKTVTRENGAERNNLYFKYDPMGNRIIQAVENKLVPEPSVYNKIYYLRDAQGNIMATYEKTLVNMIAEEYNIQTTFALTERPVYGSSRIAVNTEPIVLAVQNSHEGPALTTYGSPEILSHTNGYKHFELTNHLGNVMAVVSDKRTPIITGSAITGYTPELLIAKDYYPFGMEMSGRYTGVGNEDPDNKYRFGFNGQEKDDEITGHTGSVYTAMFWEYDARIGRRWNLDPKPQISISDYACFANNPIVYIDPYGDSTKIRIGYTLRKELNLTRKEAKNYTVEKLADVFEYEYGMCVEVRNGYLHYTGESDNQPECYSPKAKEMWKNELGPGKGSGKIVLRNRGKDFALNKHIAYINLASYGNLSDGFRDRYADYSIAPNDFNLIRTWNLGRVIEHEYLFHVVLKLEDYSNINSKIGWGEDEFRYLPNESRTTVQMENEFRIEMGLENYQRLFYRTNDNTLLLIFGHPDDAFAPLFPVPYK